MPHRPRAAFFDLDGTLMDREPLAQEAVREVGRRHDLTFSDDQLAPLVGRAWQDVYRALAIELLLGWDLETFVGEVFGQADALLADGFETRILEGAVELIHFLHAEDVPVWLVTGSRRSEADAAIRHLGLAAVFDGSLAAEEYGRGKPDPECYRTAARLAGVAPEQHDRCIVVEDSEPGVQAGLAAGMRVLATTAANRPPGHPSHQDVRSAHVVVASLAEVDPTVLARLLA